MRLIKNILFPVNFSHSCIAMTLNQAHMPSYGTSPFRF